MVLIKILFLASFMLAFALASEKPKPKPLMAALQVQSNFDFSLTRKEFRVHYFGLGDEFTTTDPESVSIKIYRSSDGEEVVSYDLSKDEKNERKAFHFALNDMQDGKYEVEICADSACSGKTPSLTDVKSDKKKLTCKQGQLVDGNWVPASPNPTFELDFNELTNDDWSKATELDEFEKKINAARKLAGLEENFKTDFSRHTMGANPAYKKDGGIVYAAFKYDLTKYKQLFDKHQGKNEARNVYPHDICERKYLLSAHAHLVDEKTKKVQHRFKTTLFLSAGGKKMFVFGDDGEKVHVEVTHEGVTIPKGDYKLWLSLCATEKDAIESTYCVDPIITDLKVPE